MVNYKWDTEHTRVKKVLKMSHNLKVKAGWSREVGCGFIEQEIEEIQYDQIVTLTSLRYKLKKTEKVLTVHLTAGRILQYKPDEFNLRETEEMLKWAEEKVKQEKITKIRGE